MGFGRFHDSFSKNSCHDTHVSSDHWKTESDQEKEEKLARYEAERAEKRADEARRVNKRRVELAQRRAEKRRLAELLSPQGYSTWREKWNNTDLSLIDRYEMLGDGKKLAESGIMPDKAMVTFWPWSELSMHISYDLCMKGCISRKTAQRAPKKWRL